MKASSANSSAAARIVDARAPNQSTALMLAARNGHRGVVEALVKAGADISLVNENGLTAAAWARENKNTISPSISNRALRGGPPTGRNFQA